MTVRPLSRAEVRGIDVRAADELGLPTLVLMENAGRGAAAWLRGRVEAPSAVLVACGPGNNGGDGGVVARHLDAWGYRVRVVWFARPEELRGDAAVQWNVLDRSGIDQESLQGEAPDASRRLDLRLAEADWVVDALLGTGLSRPVQGHLAAVIEALNRSGKPILALDLPSGLDADTGRPLGVAVRAEATATFVAPKLGFGAPEAAAYTGEVAVIDIGVPGRILEPFLVARAFVPPGPVKQAVDLGELTNEGVWRVGDRVLVRWLDFFWYPGTILSMGTMGYQILYDDGDQRVVQEPALMPLAVEEGEQIQIRPKSQPQQVYAPAVVTHADGESLDVVYEDGEHETNTKVSRARFWRCPVATGACPFEEGDRVLAYDIDEFVYPAEVVSLQDDRVIVQFLDGPQRILTPELIRRFDLCAGSRIQCRRKGGPHYFPGTLAQFKGDRALVRYDDGAEEWTSVRLVRIKPET